MILQDRDTYRQVIGSLMKKPSLFLEYDDIDTQDFGMRLAKIIFTEIKDMAKNNIRMMDSTSVDMHLSSKETQYQLYQKDNGLQFLKDSYDFSQVENFDYYYKKLKKLSLIQKLKKNGYNVSYYFKEDCDTLREENEIIDRFEKATLNDILNYVEGEFNKLKNDFFIKNCNGGTAANGIQHLIESLAKNPEIGAQLEGELFSSACRGARMGKFYLRSASSGMGKSRLSVFDSCKIAFPMHWDSLKNTFVIEKDRDGNKIKPKKVLMITTEMDRDEIRTIMLAYLSGVNERKIVTGQYDEDEKKRVVFAGNIIEKYKDFYFLEEISDPNLINVETVIKRYVTIEKVKYVFYDYIFSSPSLLTQFQEAKIREDVALGLLSNQLKQIAKDYNIFVMSSTQVNASGMQKEVGFKDESCLRGAKSIADKIDMGCIISRVSDDEFTKDCLPKIKAAIANSQLGSYSALGEIPTHVIDIYKMRRGQYKNVRIWCSLDLGTGERHDLFMTRMDNTPIYESDVMSIYETGKREEINWKEVSIIDR